MVTVATVLRSGGVYDVRYVWNLVRGLQRHAPEHEFVCLSDVSTLGLWRIPLEHKWPGWWSKMELFRPGLFSGPVVYIDLDTVIVGDVHEIFECALEVACLEDFLSPNMVGSGILTWHSDDLAGVWERFIADPDKHVKVGRRMDTFLRPSFKNAARLQDRHPGQIVSFKKHVRPSGNIPDGARIVCMHGEPRLHNLPSEDIVRKQWDL